MYFLLQEWQPQVLSRLIWATSWQALQIVSLLMLMRPSLPTQAGQHCPIPFLSWLSRHQRRSLPLPKVPLKINLPGSVKTEHIATECL